MCNVYYVCVTFAEGWSGKATSLDISGGRSCSRGAHSGLWQSLWKWLVLQLCMVCVSLQKATESIFFFRALYGIWNVMCILGVTRHEAQQWCLAHAFELVELNPQELPDEDGEFYIQQKKNTMTLHTFILSFFMFCLCCLYQMTSQNPQEWRELSRLSMPTCGPVSKWRMVRWHHQYNYLLRFALTV